MRVAAPDLATAMIDEFKTPGQKLAHALQGPGEASYRWTRFFLLRGLGLVYLIAFLAIDHQWLPLVGDSGLLPVERYLEGESPWSAPSLFWLSQADGFATALGWLGTALAALVVAGRVNAVIMAALWVLYLSFANVGQIFWGYGWEMLLLEAGFLAIFLPPLVRTRPFPDQPPSPTVIWLYRWLIFRVMFGAGLIKLRGDPCWTELTCLAYHYETQPIPNPVSWYLDRLPEWWHRTGVLFNHLVEVVVPWFVFAPRRLRHAAGGLIVVFQGTLILSGNLSFLNLLTIVVAFACFDDRLWESLVPADWRSSDESATSRDSLSRPRRYITWTLAAGIALLSVNPVLNLVSPDQSMNRSYTPLHLVNTYGAFGGVTRTRYELEIQGTRDETLDDQTDWRTYRFPCKPGPLDRPPCIVFPYHYRLDWQIWFSAMREQAKRDWLVSLADRLLRGHEGVESLLAKVPFEKPPEHIRIVRYRYEFTERWADDDWWTRERTGLFLRPVSLDSEKFLEYLRRRELAGSPSSHPE